MKSINAAHELAVDSMCTALILLMETKPYEKITITEITKKAGVSRMAYYRNYESKDDILLKRLEKNARFVEATLQSKVRITEESVWREIAEDIQREPVMEYIIRAGLLGNAFSILKDFLTRLYTNVFGWNDSDNDTTLLIYQRLGILIGLLMYTVEQKHNIDIDNLVKRLMSLGCDRI